MEDHIKASLPSVSLPAGQQEMPTSAVSNFSNSGELDKLLSQVFQSLGQARYGESGYLLKEAPIDTFGMISPEQLRKKENPMQHWQENQMPAFAESLFANRSLAAMAQTPPTQCLREASTKSQLPEQTVLFEACTISQPLNAALRDGYSTGTYYFLK